MSMCVCVESSLWVTVEKPATCSEFVLALVNHQLQPLWLLTQNLKNTNTPCVLYCVEENCDTERVRMRVVLCGFTFPDKMTCKDKV